MESLKYSSPEQPPFNWNMQFRGGKESDYAWLSNWHLTKREKWPIQRDRLEEDSCLKEGSLLHLPYQAATKASWK